MYHNLIDINNISNTVLVIDLDQRPYYLSNTMTACLVYEMNFERIGIISHKE